MASHERPTTAFVLSLIGGIFIILVGVLLSAAVATVAPVGGAFYFLIILATSVMVLLGAAMLYVSPEHHTAWGIVIIVFSFVSILGLGGLLIGMILGIVGGALGISWKPAQATPPPPPPITRICPQCGRVVVPDVKYCPNCGKALT